jgi:hypothetical protein
VGGLPSLTRLIQCAFAMQSPCSGVRRTDRVFLILLIVLSCCFSYLQWSKIPSFWGDSARWMFETFRVFQGDIPYRDVASLYPPLSLYTFAIAYKLFGQTFGTVQMLLDILCFAMLASTYALSRLFVRAGISSAVVICLTFCGVSSDSSFSLFRLSIYTPSILMASLGLNLFLMALILGMRRRTLRLSHVLLATLGCTLSLLSRIEFLLPIALCMGFASLSLWNRQNERSALKVLGVALVIIVPTLLVFGYLIEVAGFSSVLEGLMIYGSTSMVCPYWPTGLGLLGFLAGLCEGTLVYIFGTLLSDGAAGKRRYLLGLATAASLVIGVYLYAAWPDFPRYWALPTLEQFSSRQTLIAALSLTHVLVPVMGVAVALTLATFWRIGFALVKHRCVSEAVTDEAVLYAAGAALGIRSLFGTLWTEIPGVSPVAYSTLFVIGGVLLSKAFRLRPELTPTGRGMIRGSIPVCLFLAYGLGRLFWYYHVESGAKYYPLDTLAGRVLISSKASVDVYNYVVANTRGNDFVADFGYGGGINFAARRRGPLFMTMFSFVMPSERYLTLDVERMKSTSPALVIGQDLPHLGAKYGSGTTNGCMFPRVVWRSTRISGDVEKPLPAISLVEANYTPVRRTDGILVLARAKP